MACDAIHRSCLNLQFEHLLSLFERDKELFWLSDAVSKASRDSYHSHRSCFQIATARNEWLWSEFWIGVKLKDDIEN